MQLPMRTVLAMQQATAPCRAPDPALRRLALRAPVAPRTVLGHASTAMATGARSSNERWQRRPTLGKAPSRAGSPAYSDRSSKGPERLCTASLLSAAIRASSVRRVTLAGSRLKTPAGSGGVSPGHAPGAAVPLPTFFGRGPCVRLRHPVARGRRALRARPPPLPASRMAAAQDQRPRWLRDRPPYGRGRAPTRTDGRARDAATVFGIPAAVISPCTHSPLAIANGANDTVISPLRLGASNAQESRGWLSNISIALLLRPRRLFVSLRTQHNP